jgi:rhodanese-related sulfurtransferase
MRIIIALVLTLLVTAAGVFAAAKDITSTEARTLLEKNRKVYILDVRTPEESRQARIRGAVLIPVGELKRRVGEVPKNRTILVYCAVGSRSRSAVEFLSQQGYGEIYNMSDGIVGWYRNGFPVDR